MNEQFKLLSDEAHEFALKTIEYGENFGDIWIEKFGKLIIQDCIKELEISRRCDPYTVTCMIVNIIPVLTNRFKY